MQTRMHSLFLDCYCIPELAVQLCHCCNWMYTFLCTELAYCGL